jgi:hypothetical protein
MNFTLHVLHAACREFRKYSNALTSFGVLLHACCILLHHRPAPAAPELTRKIVRHLRHATCSENTKRWKDFGAIWPFATPCDSLRHLKVGAQFGRERTNFRPLWHVFLIHNVKEPD